jgi:hypothetical protein
MKLTRYFALGALAYCASAAPMFAITIGDGPSAPTLYKFEYDPTTPTTGFSPTFIEVLVPTGDFGATLAASSAIVDFQITTPEGVWTPTGYSGASLGTTTPNLSGNLEVTGNGSIVDFLDSVTISANEFGAVPADARLSGFVDQVTLTTTSVSDTITFIPAPAGNDGSQGTWNPVPLNAPEAGNTFLLLLVSAAGLGVYRQFQTSDRRVLARIRSR